MSGPSFRRIRYGVQVLFPCCAAIVAASLAQGQSTVALSGVVTDSANTPVFGANISLTGTSLSAITDERGEFRIGGVLPGTAEVRVRRFGFVPVVREIRIVPQGSPNRLDVRLAQLPATLKPVLVRANGVQYAGRLGGYYERLSRRTSGHFIARDEIDRSSHRSLSRLLTQVPGINALQLRGGGGAVRMRGRSCRPLVWLDGVPMPAGEVDLDAFPASTLHGIEVYLGSSSTPLTFTAPQAQSSCGTILLWSRGRDTEVPARLNHRGVDLEQMVASLSVYTADQVDKQAELQVPVPLQVAYPMALSATGISGSVVAEFIVDTEGSIEAGTFAIVSSTHPLFSEAVSRAVQGAKYTPAVKGNVAVRQVIQQSFAFAPGSGRPQKGGKAGGT